MRGRILVTIVFLGLSCSYAQAGLSDGLMAYYPFNNNANDLSGNGYHLTPIGGSGYTTGYQGSSKSAASFNGVDGHMDGGSYDIINPLSPLSFTVSFWFSPASTWSTNNNPDGALLGNIENYPVAPDPQGQTDWGIFIASESSLYFWWIDDIPSVTEALHTTTTNWLANQWYHVAFTYDVSNTTLKAWINGKVENSMTVASDFGRNNAGSTLAIARYNTDYADMALEELRLYNRSLSADEIGDLATIPTPAAILLTALGSCLVTRMRTRRVF